MLSLNLHRRSLSASQRATIAVEAKKSLEAEIAEETRKKQAASGKAVHRGAPKPEEKVFTKNGKHLSETPPRNAQEEAAKLAKVSPAQ